MKQAFIVGCPRSGTTLLQAVLNAHPEVTSFPESHFFNVLKNPRRSRHYLLRSNKGAVDALLHKYAGELEAEEFLDKQSLAEARRYKDHVAIFSGLLDGVATRREASLWIEKTPRHLHNIKLIQRYFPKAGFIHLIRDGLATVASLYKVAKENPAVWGGERSVESCCERWLYDIDEHRKYLGAKGHFFCSYRDLVEQKEKTAQQLASFLGLRYVASMTEDFSASFDQIVEKGESWKRRVKGPIEDASNASAVFTPDQLQYVQSRLSAVNIDEFRIG